MKLEKLTITARASLNYQVSEVSLEISDFNKEDIAKVETLVINESVKMVKKESELTSTNSGNQKQPEVQVQKTSEIRRAVPPMQNTYQPKMVSDGQIAFLRKLGYPGPFDGMTSYQASQLINQYKGGAQ